MKPGHQALYNGYPDASRMLSDVRRLCGHCSTGPTAVWDHSKDRMSSPISPPPAKTASGRASSRIIVESLRRAPHLELPGPRSAALRAHRFDIRCGRHPRASLAAVPVESNAEPIRDEPV